MPRRRASLRQLPTELRLMIYGYALQRTGPLLLRDLLNDNGNEIEIRTTATGILLACTQSFQDAGHLLFEINTVVVSLDGDIGPNLELTVLDQIAPALRWLVVEVGAVWYVYNLQDLHYHIDRLQTAIDSAPSLSQLSIVLHVPGLDFESCDQVLECFARLHFEGEVTIAVDVWNPDRQMPDGYGPSSRCLQDVHRAIRRYAQS